MKAPAAEQVEYLACSACLTARRRDQMVFIRIGQGFDLQLVCENPAACRQRGQLRGVWGVAA